MAPGSMRAGLPLSEEEKRRLIRKLVAQLRCAACGRPYAAEDLSLVHRWQNLWVLSTRCRHCNEPCQIVIFMHLEAEPEPSQDLTPEEAEVADEWPPITADDVMNTHAFLQSFDGDFEALFRS
jgi:hypothetical protein